MRPLVPSTLCPYRPGEPDSEVHPGETPQRLGHAEEDLWASDLLASELQALVYDILPPISAIINYATGHAEQLSANAGQFFAGAQIKNGLYSLKNLTAKRNLRKCPGCGRRVGPWRVETPPSPSPPPPPPPPCPPHSRHPLLHCTKLQGSRLELERVARFATQTRLSLRSAANDIMMNNTLGETQVMNLPLKFWLTVYDTCLQRKI